MSGGGLTSAEAFEAVFGFLRSEFAGWQADPLHTQFSDNEFGDRGEIRHTSYGEGTLRVAPLIQAAQRLGVRMTVISESRDRASHEAIRTEAKGAWLEPVQGERRAASAPIEFPAGLDVVADGGRFRTTRAFRDLSFANLDKVFFPDPGYTKGDLIEYYNAVAPALTPHLSDRAIVMARFPDGATGGFFYEKQAPGHQPDWMPLAPIHSSHRGEDIEFVTAADAPSLTWLASMGCIEIHPWLSRMPTLECPDFAIFDLDPADGASWEQVVDVAGLVRVLLDRVGLEGYPKTSGASGIHIYVPLDPIHPYGRVRRFVEAVGELLVAANPDDVTMEWDIPKRRGKVFVDHNQNVGGKTIASVYSVRPTPVASVSTPIAWDELDTAHPHDFTIATIWDRLEAVGDLFGPVLLGGQRLDRAERLIGLED
jgi:bifunctional non-homologous end joining protein LigD